MSETQTNWLSDIDEESIKKAVNVGEILPRMKLPDIDQVVTVKFAEEPRLVKNEKLAQGEAIFAVIEHEGAKMDIILPKSLRFNLRREMVKNNLDKLVGNMFKMGATKQTVGAYKDAKVYWAQLVKDQESLV